MKLTSSILSAIAVLLIYNRQCLCRKIPRELKPFIKPADPGKFSDIADAFKDKIIRGKSRSYTITNTVLGRGFNGVVFLGFIASTKEDEAKDKPVAVKIQRVKDADLESEYRMYEKLGAVDRSCMNERKDCLPSVYYFKKNVKLGTIAVDAMFMQLFQHDLFHLVYGKILNFSLKDVLSDGLFLAKCLKGFHKQGVILSDVKLSNILVPPPIKSSKNLRLFLSDFGAATSPGSPIIAATFSYATPRYLEAQATGGEKPVIALEIDDFHHLFFTLISFFHRLPWYRKCDRSDKKIAAEYAISILENRNDAVIEELCEVDTTGTLWKFWLVIKDELDNPETPTNEIISVLEGGVAQL